MIFVITLWGRGITMADNFGPDGQDPQDNSQQKDSYQYHYNYNYSYGSGRGTTPPGGFKPPKSSGDWGEWAIIAILFLALPGPMKLFPFFWLLSKLGKMSSSDKQRYKREAKNAAKRARNTAESFFRQGADAARQAADSTRQQAQGAAGGTTYHYQYDQSRQKKQAQPKAEPWEAKDQAEERKRSRRQSKLMGSSGKGLIIAGSIIAGIFGLGTLAVMTPIFLGEFEYPLIIPIVACLMFAAGGVSMLASGIGKGHRNERYLNYLAYIGANREVALAPMAASFDVPVSKLCKDLRRMLAKGILPTGYLDLAEGKLYLTEMGYHAPEPKREAPPVQEETPQQAAAREDDILREIRQVNDEIPDEAMSAKIDRIEEITGKILAYQKTHPNKEGQLRTFLNYYLPTTLKILRAYAQLDAQGIEGENISAAKKRIEDMMDQVVSGFEKQLDKLFQDDAMDITSDVEVLENMLKKDGLSDEGGITMTL